VLRCCATAEPSRRCWLSWAKMTMSCHPGAPPPPRCDSAHNKLLAWMFREQMAWIYQA
jgi:hypothetical protein